MKAHDETVKRCRGRPQVRPDVETLRLIHEAARHAFVEGGYAATCMETVAARAWVSTKTLYRLIPTKTALFQGMVTSRLDEFFSKIAEDIVDEPDLASALEAMLVDCAGLTLDPEVIGLHRLVIAESDRFPEIAEMFYKEGVQRVPVALAEWLGLPARRGVLRLDDPKAAAGMLLGMMISEPQRGAILRQRKPMSPNEIRKRAHVCAELFLKGCTA